MPKTPKQFWNRNWGPWIVLLLVLWAMYMVLVDTKLPEGIVGGF